MLYRRTERRGRRACATQHVAQFIRTSCAEAERWGRDPGRVDPNAKREGEYDTIALLGKKARSAFRCIDERLCECAQIECNKKNCQSHDD